MSQKYEAPEGPPPGYGSGAAYRINSPAPAHTQSPAPSSDYYGASPYQGNAYPQPNNGYPPQLNGYYAPGPQMGYSQQPQMGYGPEYGQRGYGPPQGGYYNGGYAPGYGPQGQYLDDRRGGSTGFMEAMIASLACCCCLDACLLF